MRKIKEMQLHIKEDETGYTITLDDKELRGVENYEIKKNSASPKQAMLTLTMLVECIID